LLKALALHLFEVVHARLYDSVADAVPADAMPAVRIRAYGERVLGLIDECPEAIRYLHDQGGELFARASRAIRDRSLLDQARALAASCMRGRGKAARADRSRG
jgi:hypothetical protein